MSKRFEGTADYVATDDLKIAVNAAIALERPLLIKGEPGTGKTVLAYEIAKALEAPLITWHIKSTTKALQGLYEYEAVTRLRDSQLGDERVKDVSNYIKRGKLWEAFDSEERPVLLIDEIDKADIEFPNDLLQELDRMEFYVYETNETIKAKIRPVVLITSNNEKELPDAFLRRCFFHYIRFPEEETMRAIIDETLVARRSPAVLAGIFSGVALLLAAIGTYGVLAYAVGQRKREIGVRMALGAQPRQVLALFLGIGATLLGIGVGLGFVGSWFAGRAMEKVLFGVSPLNVGVLAASTAVMVLVVFFAILLPSRRAAGVNPIDALRDD